MNLVRIVRTPEGEVKLDDTSRTAGRGAYLCADVRCLEQAVRQKKLARALGASIGEDIVEDERSVER
jgi:predicted RNA-binding protein YlxR (DUF448 family)